MSTLVPVSYRDSVRSFISKKELEFTKEKVELTPPEVQESRCSINQSLDRWTQLDNSPRDQDPTVNVVEIKVPGDRYRMQVVLLESQDSRSSLATMLDASSGKPIDDFFLYQESNGQDALTYQLSGHRDGSDRITAFYSSGSTGYNLIGS